MAMSLRFNQDMAWGLVNATMGAAKIVTVNPELAPPQSFSAIHMVMHSLSILSHLVRRPAMEMSLDVVLEVMVLVLTSIMSQSPWEQLQPIMRLVSEWNVLEGDLAHFHGRLHDIRMNVKHFKDVVKAHNEASASNSNSNGSGKKESSRTVQHHYIGLLADIRDAIPHFQMGKTAVVSLPLFSAVANIQLLMLAEGFRSGESWGFTRQEVRDLFRGEFEETMGRWAKPVEARILEGGSGNRTAPLSKALREKRQMQLLSEALAQGKASGWSPELLETWKRAYMGRTVRIPAAKEQDEYPRHVMRKYDQGRVRVVATRRNFVIGRRKWKKTRGLQPLAKYDAMMSMTALMYSEYWPYLLGEENGDRDEVPQKVLLRMDREIYAGPYGPWTETAELPWSVTMPSPTRPRPGRMTSMVVRSKQIVNSVQVKYGERWDVVQGGNKTGSPYLIELAEDEDIHSINVAGEFSGAQFLFGAWGRTIEALRFTSNKAVYGPYGRGTCTSWGPAVARNASRWGVAVQQPGYRLSTIQLSKTLPVSRPRLNSVLGWLLHPHKARNRVLGPVLSFPKRRRCHDSEGHEAVYFGFRSILLEAVPETEMNGTMTNRTMLKGTMLKGTMLKGSMTNRTMLNRTMTNRTMRKGMMTNRTTTNGATTNGTTTNRTEPKAVNKTF